MDKITISELEYIDNYVENRKPNVLLAYLLWFFLGALGVHRFYTRRVQSGIIMLISTVLLGPITFGLLPLIWWIVDGVKLYSVIGEIEEDLTDEAIDIVLAIREGVL